MKIIETIKTLLGDYPLSDIHIRIDQPAAIRVNGEIIRPFEEHLTKEDSESFLEHCLSEEQLQRLEEFRDIDLALEIVEHRFRANFFYSSLGIAIALRKIESEIPTMDQLKLPYVAQDIANKPNGLVLVTGPTGSGKSSSLAAMVRHINQTRRGHILTIGYRAPCIIC